MAKKYYAVAVGRQTGIFKTWDETKAQVDGFKGAKYKSFTDLTEAQNFLATGDYGPKKAKEKKVERDFKVFESKQRSISSDAACSGNPGDLEYRFVWTDTGEEIFRSEIMYGTNNIGEFLALVHVIRFVRDLGLEIPIYTDSKTAMAWVRNKEINTTFDWQNEPTISEKVKDAIDYLIGTEMYGEIRKWDTKVYGEIKADFGRK